MFAAPSSSSKIASILLPLTTHICSRGIRRGGGKKVINQIRESKALVQGGIAACRQVGEKVVFFAGKASSSAGVWGTAGPWRRSAWRRVAKCYSAIAVPGRRAAARRVYAAAGWFQTTRWFLLMASRRINHSVSIPSQPIPAIMSNTTTVKNQPDRHWVRRVGKQAKQQRGARVVGIWA